jgi:hypothetical protein
MPPTKDRTQRPVCNTAAKSPRSAPHSKNDLRKVHTLTLRRPNRSHPAPEPLTLACRILWKTLIFLASSENRYAIGVRGRRHLSTGALGSCPGLVWRLEYGFELVSSLERISQRTQHAAAPQLQMPKLKPRSLSCAKPPGALLRTRGSRSSTTRALPAGFPRRGQARLRRDYPLDVRAAASFPQTMVPPVWR